MERSTSGPLGFSPAGAWPPTLAGLTLTQCLCFCSSPPPPPNQAGSSPQQWLGQEQGSGASNGPLYSPWASSHQPSPDPARAPPPSATMAPLPVAAQLPSFGKNRLCSAQEGPHLSRLPPQCQDTSLSWGLRPAVLPSPRMPLPLGPLRERAPSWALSSAPSPASLIHHTQLPARCLPKAVSHPLPPTRHPCTSPPTLIQPLNKHRSP